MPISGVLQGFRKGGYGEKPSSPEKEKDGGGGPRLIKLTDDEAKSIGQGQPGGEVTVQVSGRLEGSSLTVMSVQGSSTMPDQEGMAAQVAGQAPVMRNQTAPSPS
jgi:hypothetical protein